MVNEVENILKVLVDNQEKSFTIRQLAVKRGINYKSAYSAIEKLEDEGIINIERVGNAKNCSFNKKFTPLVYKIEYTRRKGLLKNKNFKVIHTRLKELNFPLTVLLFGSHARNTATRQSDIDFLIITERKKEAERAISLLPLPIHTTVVNYNEFSDMARSREFSVVTEAVKNNVILLGIEEYYRMLENAG